MRVSTCSRGTAATRVVEANVAEPITETELSAVRHARQYTVRGHRPTCTAPMNWFCTAGILLWFHSSITRMGLEAATASLTGMLTACLQAPVWSVLARTAG
jgi:hypothetical protein